MRNGHAMSDLSIVEILRGAKAVLERNGWTQLDTIDEDQHASGTPMADCRVDLTGALRIAATGDPTAGDNLTAMEARMALLDVVWESASGCAGLGSWNDAEGRTVDEVYALLDAAIERAEAVSGA
jgi:hypothetical protein